MLPFIQFTNSRYPPSVQCASRSVPTCNEMNERGAIPRIQRVIRHDTLYRMCWFTYISTRVSSQRDNHQKRTIQPQLRDTPPNPSKQTMDHNHRPSPLPSRPGHSGYGAPPTPHQQQATPTARRGPGPMLASSAGNPHQNLSQAQIHQQHQQAMQERELAKRRARKPTDKTIPEGVEEIVPGVALYRQLRDMERRYDATILRKRLDVQDAVNRNVKVGFVPNY